VKLFLLFLLGLVIGVVGTFVLVGSQAPGMMITTTPSAGSVQETLDRLQEAAKADGWKVLGVRGLHESVKKHTGKDVKPVWIVDLCEPHHASKILEGDDSRVVSPFMPCSISVYEGPDGKARVGAMNAKLLGTLFGGTVKEVMAGPVAEAQAKFVKAATASN
jgi:uncharacterized protein (DUF302 family)